MNCRFSVVEAQRAPRLVSPAVAPRAKVRGWPSGSSFQGLSFQALAVGLALCGSLLLPGGEALAGNPGCPLDPNGLVLHLEADSGVATVGTDVTGWSDQSASGNDLTAGGAPQLVSGVLNGLPVIRFDGIDDFLERTATLTGLPTGNSDRTVFIVARYLDNGFGGVCYGTVACNETFCLGTSGTGFLKVQGWCLDNDLVSGEFGTGEGWLLQGAVHNSSQLFQYRDGFSIDTRMHVFDTQLTRLVVGQELNGAVFAQVDVAAALIYDRALSVTERQSVERYLFDKYLSPPCGDNLPPRALEDEVAISSGDTVAISVLDNDQDRDGALDSTSVAIVDAPTFGTAMVDPVTGIVTYMHNGTASLLDRFTYTVTDGATTSNVADVLISIGDPTCALPASGLVLLLETEVGLSTSGSAVTGWLDQSLLGNDLVVNGDPTTLAGELNGLDAISLDGTDDSLERTLSLNGFPDGNDNRTLFVVARYLSDGFGGTGYGNSSCNQAFGLSVDDDGNLIVTRWCNDLDTVVPGNGAGWLVQSARLQFGRVEHYVDDLLIDVRSNDFDTVNDRLVLGAELDGNPTLTMDMGAVLLYDRTLSPDEHLQVVNYLRSKYFGAVCGSDGPPVADDDFARVSLGQSVVIDVLDGDIDGGAVDPTTVDIVTSPAGGTLSVDAVTGMVTYTRTATDLLGDRFTYTVKDTKGLTSTEATVFVSIDPLGCPLETDGLVLHLEAGGATLTNGTTLLDWFDQSGFGNHLIAPGGPELVPGALNGQPVVRLDGVDDILERNDPLSGLPQGSTDRTLFYVVNYISGGPGGLGYGSTSCNQVFSLIVLPNGNLMLAGWCGANSFGTTEPGFGAGWITHSATLSADDYSHYKSGVLIDSGTHTFNTTDDTLVIGSEANGNPRVEMDVAEVLVYDRALSQVERDSVEDYLREKYFAPTCCAPPVITQQPVDVSVCDGDMASFSVTATGVAPVTYQWRKDGTDLVGEVSDTLTLAAATGADAGTYEVLVSTSCGSETSEMATLTLESPAVVATPPADASVCDGDMASFTVVAAGTGPFSYEWRRNGIPLVGETADTLTIDPVTAVDAASYQALVSNACGSELSVGATLSVLDAPTIASGPVGASVCEGGVVSLSVSASGASPLTYQWRIDGVVIPGAELDSLTIDPVQPGDAGVYDVVVTNGCGNVTSAGATVDVQLLPTITTQPVSGQDCVGSTITLSVQVAGATPLGFQWRQAGINIPGANASDLLLDPLALVDAGMYDVVVSNSCGSVTSDVVVVTVLEPPSINLDPIAKIACVGQSFTLTVGATGSVPLAYQWRKDGIDILGAESDTFSVASALLSDAGTYDVVVTNGCGAATSAGALVSILESPSVTTPPGDVDLCEGQPLTLSVIATGSSLSYQWQKDGVPLPGEEADTLSLVAVQLADAGSYDVLVFNGCTTVTSAPAVVTVQALPSIVTPPAGASICEGEMLVLTVTADGAPTLTYQWRKDAAPIPGATNSTLTIAAVMAADVGAYDVVVTNLCGTVTSAAAVVGLLPPSSCGIVFVRGDVNQDGSVGIADALVSLNYLFVTGAAVPTCFDSMDSDDDGVINLIDPIYTLRYLFVPGSPPPAAPGPLACGLDPTPDTLAQCDYTATCP